MSHNATRFFVRLSMPLILLSLLTLLAPTALAQNTEQSPDEKASTQELWNDFLHYINIARPKLAASYGQAILDRGTEPKDIYRLSVDTEGSLVALRRGEKLEGMEDLARSYQEKIEEGYRQWRSDPDQINKSIEMLGGSLRGYALGKQRLKESGVYAIPLLIRKLMDEQTPEAMKERIATMLEVFGRDGVRPFTEALQAKELKIVGYVANALGQIEYPSAIPALRAALLRKDLQNPDSPVRKAILSAILNCAGQNQGVMESSLAELYTYWAGQYYDRAESLLPDSRHESAFAWFWKEGTGLEQIPVPSPILVDIYAMRYAREALTYDPSYAPAVPLWLSAAIRRKSDLPAGASDPLWGEDQPTASFYALATPPRYLQDVLATALADHQSPIAIEVITALGKTAGAQSLLEPLAGGVMPLVSAMGYPDRNVRFLAAETLALARPSDPFEGSHMVLSMLNDALAQTGTKQALLVAAEGDDANKIQSALRSANFEVVLESNIDNILVAAQKGTGPDVVVVGPSMQPDAVLGRIRGEAVYAYLPVVIARTDTGTRALADRDGGVSLMSVADEEAAIGQAVDQAVSKSIGQPLDEGQATQWAIRAAKAIETLGSRGGSLYDLRRSQKALTAAAANKNAPEVQIAAAAALAVIPTAGAQQAVITLAMSDADENVRIAAFQAATRSVRRFGNQATEQMARALVLLVSQGKAGELDESAAQLLGALNLPSRQIPKLIESADKID
jgi:hypothetical protein